MPQTVLDVPQAGHCLIASLFVPLDLLKPRDGMVRTPRPTINPFGQAGGLAYAGRAALALRARPMAQLRCSETFSAIVLASGTVWLSVVSKCIVAKSCFA
jgi:hypothetical protein